jgi:hypothetical protein
MISLGIFALIVASGGGAVAGTVPRPKVLAFTASPTHLAQPGGTVVLTVRTRNATTCAFSGQLTLKLGCTRGKVVIHDRVGANRTFATRVLKVWLVARGKGGSTPKRSVTITQAGRPKPPPTTTTSTTTTSTTTTTGTTTPATECSGPCKFTFPSPDTLGFASVGLNSLAQGVPCPDPGYCDAASSQQVDDVNVTMCAGPSGANDAGLATDNFSLALSDGTQASLDSVTDDSSVATAFGNYGAVAPGQCVTGDVYFDATSGTQWSSLNFSYTAANFSSQVVYVWEA